MRFDEARAKSLAKFEKAVERLRTCVSAPEWWDEDDVEFRSAMGDLADACTLLGRINGVALEVGETPWKSRQGGE